MTSLQDSVREAIEAHLARHRVVLFMKGRRTMPQCGFSARVVSILDELGQAAHFVNVLDSPELREGIKAYANWPTIPQLYVDGKFVGGCDIVSELHASGELEQLLGIERSPQAPPDLSLSDAAVRVLRQALADAREASVRFSVDAELRPSLDLAPPEPGDVELVCSGIRFAVPRSCVSKVDGTKIDFVGGEQGGFRIENPNEPPRVRGMLPRELRGRLEREEDLVLVDVRPEEERTLAKIPGAIPLDDESLARLRTLDRAAATLIFHCHHGGRSLAAAEDFVRAGFKRVYNLDGGIEAWSLQVDNTVPRY